MITYVNTVFVGTGQSSLLPAMPTSSAAAGSIIIVDKNGTAITTESAAAVADEIKIGMVTKKSYTDKNGSHPIVKWSNIIKKADVKSIASDSYSTGKNTNESVVITFPDDMSTFEGKRLVLRITYKDLPTRYRKWTESYEYTITNADIKEVEKEDGTKEMKVSGNTIANAFKNEIEKNWKRARVTAIVSGNELTLRAMDYDDDKSDPNTNINPAAKVRFSVNMWYTDPTAPKFASKNKYSIDGLSIVKTPAKWYAGEPTLVRDREYQGMGYLGILNRGEGTWPIIKPEMNVDMTKQYNYVTLEFENMYRAADDIFRKTKQTVEIYEVSGAASYADIKKILEAFVSGQVSVAAASFQSIEEEGIND